MFQLWQYKVSLFALLNVGINAGRYVAVWPSPAAGITQVEVCEVDIKAEGK